MSVDQQNDRFRTQNQVVLASYQASIDIAKMSQEAALRVQAAYVDQQMALTRSQQSTDVAIINFARLFGRGANLLEPGAGGSALSYSERLGEELAGELQEAARRGQLVSFDGWNDTLPNVALLQQQFDAIPPLAIPPTPAMEMESGELGSIEPSRK